MHRESNNNNKKGMPFDTKVILEAKLGNEQGKTHTLETQMCASHRRAERAEQMRLIKAAGLRGCVGNLLAAVVQTAQLEKVLLGGRERYYGDRSYKR